MLKEKYHPFVIKPYKPLKAKGQNQESKKSQLPRYASFFAQTYMLVL